jgi:hypothetical protein
MKKILTKPIYLLFSNSSTTSANISVPFIVNKIKCKGIVYSATSTVTIPEFGVLTSSLVENQALGIYFDNSRVTPFNSNETEFLLNSPTDINGSHTFTIYNDVGNLASTVSNGIDTIILLLEFSSE